MPDSREIEDARERAVQAGATSRSSGAGSEDPDPEDTEDAHDASVSSKPRRLPLSRRLRRLRRRVARRLVVWFGPFLLRRLSRTWTLDVLGSEHLVQARGAGGGHFMALWHGRMLLGLARHGEQEWHVLVSGSQDGDISQALLDGFRYRVIRGSTSRGGARALREMLDALEKGAVLVITPDGPRGPRHSMNPGLAWMARATGHAIVPCGFACDRAWRAKSWDRFTIPKRRARVVMAYGPPVRVPRSASPLELDEATEAIRLALMEAERRAFSHLELEPDW
jgi:lysophospholipid acyltransferase (LPLAT)-like uncharacterized protein